MYEEIEGAFEEYQQGLKTVTHLKKELADLRSKVEKKAREIEEYTQELEKNLLTEIDSVPYRAAVLKVSPAELIVAVDPDMLVIAYPDAFHIFREPNKIGNRECIHCGATIFWPEERIAK